jgi:hypothetical protein
VPVADPFATPIDEDDEPVEAGTEGDDDIPLVGAASSYRRAVPSRRRGGNNSNVIFIIGGLVFIALVGLMALLLRDPPATSRSIPRSGATPRGADRETGAASPTRPAPAPEKHPTPPPPRPPRFESGPLIDEMAKATVTSLMESVPSAQPRFRELWESQLHTQLVQETKRMREEGEIRAAVNVICDAWAQETQAFLNSGSEPEPEPKPDFESAPAPEGAPAMEPADGEAMPSDDAEEMEPE